MKPTSERPATKKSIEHGNRVHRDGTLTHGLFDRWAGRFKPVLAEMLIRKGGRLRGIDAATPTPEDCTPRRPIRHSARRCPLSPPPPLCSPPAPASPAPPCAPPRPRVSPPRAASRSSAPRRRVRSFSALLLLSPPPAHALVTRGGSDRRLWRGFDRRATRVRRGCRGEIRARLWRLPRRLRRPRARAPRPPSSLQAPRLSNQHLTMFEFLPRAQAPSPLARSPSPPPDPRRPLSRISASRTSIRR